MDDAVREDAIDRKIRLLREKNKELEKRHQMVQEDKRRAEAGGRAVNTRNPTTKPSKQFGRECSKLMNMDEKQKAAIRYSRTYLLSLRKQSLFKGSVKFIDDEFCYLYLISKDSSAIQVQLHEIEEDEIVSPACGPVSSTAVETLSKNRLAEQINSPDNVSACSEKSKVSDDIKEYESPCDDKLSRIRDFVEDLTTTRMTEFLKLMSTRNQQVLDFIGGSVKDKRYGNAHMDSAHDEDAELNAYRERKMQNQRRNDDRRNQQQRGRDSPGSYERNSPAANNSYSSPQQLGGGGRYQSPQNDSPQQNQSRRGGNYRSGGGGAPSDGYSDSPRGRPHRDRGQQRGGGHMDKRAMRREEQRRSNIEMMEEQMSGKIKEGDQTYQEPRGYLHDPSRNGTDEIPRGPPPRSVQYNPKDDRRRSNNRRNGPPSKAQMDVEMTGRQRQDYERWKKQADEADQYRMRKAQVKAREWDNEKVIDDAEEDRRGGSRRHDEGRRLYDENQDGGGDDWNDRRRSNRRNDQYDGQQRRRSDRGGAPKQRLDGEVLCWKLDKERNRWVEVWVKKNSTSKKERKLSELSSNSDEMSSIVSFASSDIVQEKEYHEEW